MKSGINHTSHGHVAAGLHKRSQNKLVSQALKDQSTDLIMKPETAAEPPEGTDDKDMNQNIMLGVALGTLFLLTILYDPNASAY